MKVQLSDGERKDEPRKVNSIPINSLRSSHKNAAISHSRFVATKMSVDFQSPGQLQSKFPTQGFSLHPVLVACGESHCAHLLPCVFL